MAPPLPPGYTLSKTGSAAKAPPLPSGYKLNPRDRKGDFGGPGLPGAEPVDAAAGKVQDLNSNPSWLLSALRAMVSGASLPHDVMQGQDPTMERVTDLATLALPSSVARGTGKEIAAMRSIGPKPSATPPRAVTAQAFERSDVQPTLPMVTGNRAVNVTSRAIGTTFPGYPIIKATNRATEQAGNRSTALREGLTSVTEPATAGERIQAGVKNFAEEADQRVHELYQAPPLQAMDKNVLSTASKSRSVIDKLDRAIENPEIKALLTDSNVSDLFQTIRSAGAQGISFEDLQALRSGVGKLQPAAGSKVGINKRATKALYSSLTDDIKALVKEAGGQPALHALEQADEYTRALRATRLPAIQSLIDAPSGEAVFQTIKRLAQEKGTADWRRLAQVKRSVGEQDWKDIAGVTIRDLGRGAEAEFDPVAFAKNYDMLSPKGRELLFDKDLRSALDDLFTVSESLKRVGKSGALFGANRFSTLPALIGAMVYTPGLATKAIGTSYAVAKVFTSPRIVRWLSGVKKAGKSRSRLDPFFKQIEGLSGGDKAVGDLLRRFGAAALAGKGEEKPQAGNPTMVGGTR